MNIYIIYIYYYVYITFIICRCILHIYNTYRSGKNSSSRVPENEATFRRSGSPMTGYCMCIYYYHYHQVIIIIIVIYIYIFNTI
jgi:hypothetical protein